MVRQWQFVSPDYSNLFKSCKHILAVCVHKPNDSLNAISRILLIMIISAVGKTFYFIRSSEFNAYLKQIKVILSTVKYFFPLVTNTIVAN